MTPTAALPTGQGARTGLPDSGKPSQRSRAQQAGISRDTQNKLDKLARLRPDLFGCVRAGEMTVSRACILAGWSKERTTVEMSGAGLIRAFDRLPIVEQKAVVERIQQWIDDECSAPW